MIFRYQFLKFCTELYFRTFEYLKRALFQTDSVFSPGPWQYLNTFFEKYVNICEMSVIY